MDECSRCGRSLNRHGACINLFCGAPIMQRYTRARDARARPRRIWRGIDGGQSIVMLQVMGEMWSTWLRWGDVPSLTRS